MVSKLFRLGVCKVGSLIPVVPVVTVVQDVADFDPTPQG